MLSCSTNPFFSLYGWHTKMWNIKPAWIISPSPIIEKHLNGISSSPSPPLLSKMPLHCLLKLSNKSLSLSLSFSFQRQPDHTFHNFRAFKSADRRTLCYSEASIYILRHLNCGRFVREPKRQTDILFSTRNSTRVASSPVSIFTARFLIHYPRIITARYWGECAEIYLADNNGQIIIGLYWIGETILIAIKDSIRELTQVHGWGNWIQVEEFDRLCLLWERASYVACWPSKLVVLRLIIDRSSLKGQDRGKRMGRSQQEAMPIKHGFPLSEHK